ncbi:GGDEF domain-containing protein [Wenzhouxiangella sp. AB-CW3]|uniref:GGDEF domain-containing protein n=1 Tax=Wenzhouxiangella sp. AB-CW3 TaxID=2771012 RepID=UPI00168BBA32|nr:sensor domain-containing diguanylate cyclase [Wenzhouxiangella sp. AB-CW3]QOC23695.1 GGDEF domain-containing protein [Wenzhouxiangella sp. AB-CW3]
MEVGPAHDVTDEPSLPGMDLYAGFMETMPDAAMLVDQDGYIERANHLAQEFFAAGEKGLENRSVNALLPVAKRHAHMGHMSRFWRHLQRREMGAGGDLIAQRLDGSTFPIDIMLSPVELAEGTRVVCVMRDRTRHKEKERQLCEALAREKELALTDPLTGAANTRHLGLLMEQVIERMKRKGTATSVAYVDLDNFKTVNSHGGHSAGDRALRKVADTIRTSLRGTDLLARAGGDEFVIVLPETDRDAASKVIDRVLQRLGQAMRESSWPITFSVGVATFRRVPESVDEAIQQADDLMYEIKNSGRDACRYAVLD